MSTQPDQSVPDQASIAHMITLKELVRLSGIEETKIRSWITIRKNPLPSTKFGNAIAIDYAVFQQWLVENTIVEQVYRLKPGR